MEVQKMTPGKNYFKNLKISFFCNIIFYILLFLFLALFKTTIFSKILIYFIPTFFFIAFTIISLWMFLFVIEQIKINYKTKKIIKNIHLKSISSIKNEFAKIKGKAKIDYKNTGKILKSPISKKNCLYYYLSIEKLIITKEKNSDGSYRTKKTWETIFDKKEGSFFISDNFGEILIDPKEAEITNFSNYFYSTKDKEIEKVIPDNMNFSKINFNSNDLSKVPLKEEYALLNDTSNTYQIYEYFIEPHKDIFALGYVEYNKNNDLKKLVKKDDVALIVSNNEKSINEYNSMMLKVYCITFFFLIIVNIMFYFAFKFMFLDDLFNSINNF